MAVKVGSVKVACVKGFLESGFREVDSIKGFWEGL